MSDPETSPRYLPQQKPPALLRLENFLQPWQKAADPVLIDSLTFTMEELATRMNVSIGDARSLLRKNPPRITTTDGQYVLQELAELPTPSRSTSLSESIRIARMTGLNPKRILFDSRFESRSPGGGPVQKSGIRRDKVPGQIKRQSSEKQLWGFSLLEEKRSKESQVETRYPELRAYFRRIGGKNWIMGNNESLLCNALERCQRNKENRLEIILWNCFSFTYAQKNNDTYPTAQLLPFFDTAITTYFKTRIAELVTTLSGYSKNRLTILVPTNEAFGDEAEIWNFSQDRFERDRIVGEAINIFRDTVIPSIPETPTPIRVMRWDVFLKEQGIRIDQNEFSRQGYELLRTAVPDNLTDAGRHAQLYFDQYGISVTPSAEVIERQGKYLGMYAGEGLAYKLITNRGKNLLVLNLEEGRVPKMNFIGSNGTVPIIQGANPSEIQSYYAWKKSIISRRKL